MPYTVQITYSTHAPRLLSYRLILYVHDILHYCKNWVKTSWTDSMHFFAAMSPAGAAGTYCCPTTLNGEQSLL